MSARLCGITFASCLLKLIFLVRQALVKWAKTKSTLGPQLQTREQIFGFATTALSLNKQDPFGAAGHIQKIMCWRVFEGCVSRSGNHW